MMSIAMKLWSAEDGAVITAELILVLSILVIGVITGLSALRDSLVTELADVAQAIANIDQSYSYTGTVGHHAYNGGGFFFDQPDFCDGPTLIPGQQSKCVQLCTASAHPGGPGSDGLTSP